MPQFSLGRHTNRSSNALAEPVTPVAVAAGGSGQQPSSAQAARPSGSRGSQQQPQAHPPAHQQPNSGRSHVYSQSQNQNQVDPNASPSAGQPDHHFPSRESSLPQRLSRQQLAQSGGSGGAPLPLLPHDQQQQGPYDSSPDPSAREASEFDARQPNDSAVNRSQSQRYSTYIDPRQQAQYQPTQQFQHQQGYSSASLEDVSSSAAYPTSQHSQAPTQAQVPGQEKKSKRRFIKDILFSSSKSQNDQGQQQPAQQPAQHTQQPLDQGQSFAGGSSYDNTSGLARRPSKRESNPPAINTRLSKPPPLGHQYQEGEWNQGQGSYSLETSPLHDVGEDEQVHYIGGEVDRDYRSREGQVQGQGQGQGQPGLDPNTIRSVGQDSDSSPYDEEFHHHQHQHPSHSQQHHHQQQQQQVLPHHLQQLQPHSQQLQPQVQQGTQDQQLQHQRSQPRDESQQQAHQFPPPPSQQPQQPFLAEHQQSFAASPSSYQQVGEPRLVSSHIVAPPPQQQQQLQHQHQHQQHQQQQQLQYSQQQQLANPETISQVSYESPVTDSDPPSGSQQSVQPSPGPKHTADLVSTPNLSSAPLVISPQPQHAVMAPPPTGAPSANRGDKGMPTTAGPPPGYRQSNTPVGALSIPANQAGPQSASAGGPFRGDATPRFESPSLDQGRNSPQPERGAEDDKSFKDLLTKYKNVKRLYFEGKNRLEELTGQVEVLQNAVANQRITQSRTALDDNEYLTRFNRLNGAINNLSFNIRKDWKSLPSWIAPFASPDALNTGTKEMTALGRGVISRWLVDELFGKCFHPGLEPMLSAQLKQIEQSIRGNAYTMHSQEEFAALTNKVVQWRMATLDGLQKVLGSSAADENRQAFIARASSGLTAYLCQHLSQPAPPGVDGSTSMIVELAVGIAANTPMESRDVAISYPLPGDIVRPEFMEVGELELPALEKEGDEDSDVEDGKDKVASRGDKTKPGTLITRDDSQTLSGRKGSVASTTGTNNSTDAGYGVASTRDTTRVRFAGFMAWEVRGRQVLFKAPVWTL